MKNDKKITESVIELEDICNEYRGYLKLTGNPCAYSDRILEKILDTAEEIKTLYMTNN